MGFDRLHRLIAYLLVACGLGIVGLSGELNTLVVWFAVVVASASWFRTPSSSEEPSMMITAGLMGVLALLIVLGFSSGEWLIYTVYFAIAMTIAKLLQCRVAKDYFQLYTLTFLLVVGGAVVNPGLSFPLVFLVYVVLLTWGLVLLHLRRDFEDREVSMQSLRGADESEEAAQRMEAGMWRGQRLLRPSFFVGTSLLALVIFAASVVVFFVFPRLGLGFFFSGGRDGQDVAGFSSQVELGHFGMIKDNPAVVARVELPDRNGPMVFSLRLRGVSFDRYDGRRWHRDASRRNQEIPSLSDGTRKTGFNEEAHFSTRTLKQRIYQEPLNSPVLPLFGHPRVRDIQIENSALRQLKQSYRKARRQYYQAYPSGDITFSGLADRSIIYDVTSDVYEGVPAGAATAGSDYSDLLVYLYTMEGSAPRSALSPDSKGSRPQEKRYVFPPRVSALQKRLFRGKTTPLEKVRAVERYLADGFTYSLEGGHDPSDPLADFLLDRKEGHCELFASAMVLLLQAEGVPARLVNGFYGGVWNDYGDYYEIRQGDAHSWVEVYFPGYGWITFDPTPPGGAFASIEDDWLSGFYRWVDSLRLQWYKWVIEYDLEKQVEMFREIGRKLASLRNPFEGDGGEAETFGSVKDFFKSLISVRVLASFFGGLLLLWLWFRFKSRGDRDAGLGRKTSRVDVQRARRFWRRAVTCVERAGVEISAADTPEDVVERIHQRGWHCASQVASIGRVYQSVRFGKRPWTPDHEVAMRQWLGEVKEEVRKHRASSG